MRASDSNSPVFEIRGKINENSTDLLSNHSYYRFHFANKKTRRKFGPVFGTKLSDELENITAMRPLKISKRTITKLGRKLQSLVAQVGV